MNSLVNSIMQLHQWQLTIRMKAKDLHRVTRLSRWAAGGHSRSNLQRRISIRGPNCPITSGLCDIEVMDTKMEVQVVVDIISQRHTISQAFFSCFATTIVTPMFVDLCYRVLNKITIEDKYLLPLITDYIDELLECFSSKRC